MKMTFWSKVNKNITLFLLTSLATTAQENVTYYKEKYPNANEVYIKQITKVNINLINNKPEITSENYNESIVTTNNINKVSTKGSVSYSSFNPLLSIEALTQLNNKKYLVKEYKNVRDKSSRSFHDDLKLKEFDYQQLEYGAIKKLSYQSKLTDYHLLNAEIFLDNYPIDYKEFIVTTNKDINLGYLIYNNNNNQIDFSKEEKGNKIIYKWTAKNVKPFKYETNAPSVLHYAPLVEIYIKNFKNNNNQTVNVLNTITDLHNLYQEYTKTIFETPSPELLQKVNELKAKHTNEIDQVKEIYYWVKNNIKYIAFEEGYGGFIPRKPNDVFEKRYGDCKDMATLLYTMIKSTGNNHVYLTWIGSREKPFTYEQLPTQAVDDHMIAIYQNNNQNYFLDATSKDTPFTYPTSFIQGKQALMHINNTSYKLATVPIVEASLNKYAQNITFSLTNTKIKGNATASITGYERDKILANLKENNTIEQTDFLKELLQLGNNKFQLENYQISNRENRDLPLQIQYNFNIDNYTVNTNNEIFINLFLFKPNDLKEINTKRETNYQLDNTTQTTQTIKFIIPKGYKVNYIPKDIQYKNNKYSFTIKYEKKENYILLNYSITINTLLIEKNEFQDWNQFIQKLQENITESISITK